MRTLNAAEGALLSLLLLDSSLPLATRLLASSLWICQGCSSSWRDDEDWLTPAQCAGKPLGLRGPVGLPAGKQQTLHLTGQH